MNQSGGGGGDGGGGDVIANLHSDDVITMLILTMSSPMSRLTVSSPTSCIGTLAMSDVCGVDASAVIHELHVLSHWIQLEVMGFGVVVLH